MAKHRSTIYTVVRINKTNPEEQILIGAYATITRAEEVAEGAIQKLKDTGVPDGYFECFVKPVTYYDE